LKSIYCVIDFILNMTYTLSASTRNAKGEKVRAQGYLPAVVYGVGAETISLNMDYGVFMKIFKEAGESSLIDLMLDSKEAGKVLVQDVQYDPVTDKMTHVDLRRIDMSKPITATVQLRFAGEAPVVKEQGGTLVRGVDQVEVKCLPQDLVAHINVDLSSLTTFDHVIRISDLVLPPGVAIVNPSGSTLVAKATPALTEEEIKAMEAAAAPADLSQIEVAKKKEAEEGEEAAAEEGKEEEKKKEPEKKAEKK